MGLSVLSAALAAAPMAMSVEWSPGFLLWPGASSAGTIGAIGRFLFGAGMTLFSFLGWVGVFVVGDDGSLSWGFLYAVDALTDYGPVGHDHLVDVVVGGLLIGVCGAGSAFGLGA
jgi:hypothetical protein